MRPNFFLIAFPFVSVSLIDCAATVAASSSSESAAGGVQSDCTPALAQSHAVVDRVMETLRRIQRGVAPGEDASTHDDILDEIEKIKRVAKDLETCSARIASTGIPVSGSSSSSASASASENVVPPSSSSSTRQAVSTKSSSSSSSPSSAAAVSNMEEVDSDDELVIPNHVGIHTAAQDKKRQRGDVDDGNLLLKNHRNEIKASPNTSTSHKSQSTPVVNLSSVNSSSGSKSSPALNVPVTTGAKISVGSDNMMRIPNLDANTVLERLKSKGVSPLPSTSKVGKESTTLQSTIVEPVNIQKPKQQGSQTSANSSTVPQPILILNPTQGVQGNLAGVFGAHLFSSPGHVPQSFAIINQAHNSAQAAHFAKQQQVAVSSAPTNVPTASTGNFTVEGLIPLLAGPNGTFINVMRRLSKEQRERIKSALENGKTLFETAIRFRIVNQANDNVLHNIRTLLGAKLFNTVFSDGKSVLQHVIDANDIQLLTYLLNIQEIKLLVTPELAGAYMFAEGPIPDMINKVCSEIGL